MIGNSIGQQQLKAKCKTTYSQNTVVQTRNILYTESVKDSGNSTFFQKINSASWKEQKNQVSVFIFHRTKRKIVNFFVYMLVNYVKS